MPSYSELEARAAIAASRSYAEALRRLGLRAAGHNDRTLRRHAARWGIPTDHFGVPAAGLQRRRPLEEILVEGSTYSRSHLKERLYDAGLKRPVCELCGQGERWRGRVMGLVLDHINGVATDNRLENLRIVCPNCAATLDTHCGRRLRLERPEIECGHCGRLFRPKYRSQRYCSRPCGRRHARPSGPQPARRKVARPPHEQLVAELAASSYVAVARRYGVSDNAVRKWVRQYERDAAARARGP